VPEPADFIHDPSHEDSECAAVVVDRDSIIHAHRWYAAASQGRTDRGRRDFDRSGPGFNAAPIRAMQCIGDYCDDERRPDAIYCVLVPSGGVSIKRKSADPPLLTWRCTATRPAGMKSNVQFYDVRAQCQSTVDGGSLELPSPAALKIQSSPTTAPVLLPGNGVKPQIPRTLHVTRAQLESEDNDGDTLNEARCQYRLQLRSIHFYDLVRWRRKLRLSDSEVAVTSSLADVENGVVSTRVGFADDDEEDHLVAAEVCRVTYRVQLTHPIAGVVSIIALGFVIVAFFGIVVIGTNDRKSRMEVWGGQTADQNQICYPRLSDKKPPPVRFRTPRTAPYCTVGTPLWRPSSYPVCRFRPSRLAPSGRATSRELWLTTRGLRKSLKLSARRTGNTTPRSVCAPRLRQSNEHASLQGPSNRTS
jgi:hypothetical protein